MTVTDAQRKALIIAEIGDVATTLYPTGVITENIDTLWDLWAFTAQNDPYLRDLYVKRESIELVLGALRGSVDVRISGDSDVKSSQLVKTLMDMLDQTKKDLTKFSGSATGMAAGLITTVAPDSAPSNWGGLDANFKGYGGDPYYRTYPRRGF